MPFTADGPHNFMHNKVVVADDTVSTGSFNLSANATKNAENVLEIEDAAVADRLAAFVDQVRGRYGPVALTASTTSASERVRRGRGGAP